MFLGKGGETGRSIYTRSKGHQRYVRQKQITLAEHFYHYDYVLFEKTYIHF